jgi:predicted NUDIX family phosphoesterase
VCLNGLDLEELVFAVPTCELWNLLTYKKTGLIKGDSDVLNSLVQKGIFRKRRELEEDPSFKQIIPYAIISNQESYYLFKRTEGQREKRLHNKFHLGAGGHMNPCRSEEPPDAHYLVNELKRELFEEVNFLNGCFIEEIEFIGFINDDSIPVGTVHIGLLYDIHVSNKDVLINEADMMTADWIDKTDLVRYYKEIETWSKIAIDHYIMLKD